MIKLLNNIPYIKKRKEIQEYKDALEQSIKEKWPAHVIRLEELVYHRFYDESEKESTSNDKVEDEKRILVFIDKELDVDWITSFDLGQEQIDAVANAAAIESIPNKHLPKKEILAFKKIVGYSIVSAVEGSLEQSSKQANLAKEYITRRITERSRLWTLKISSIMILPFIFFIFKYYDYLFYNPTPNDFSLTIASISGVLGAYFSLIRNTGLSHLDSSSGIILHLLEIITRFIIGGISGLLVYHFAKSHFALGFMENVFENVDGIIVLSFIAGFSERFIPSMISDYEKK